MRGCTVYTCSYHVYNLMIGKSFGNVQLEALVIQLRERVWQVYESLVSKKTYSDTYVVFSYHNYDSDMRLQQTVTLLSYSTINRKYRNVLYMYY